MAVPPAHGRASIPPHPEGPPPLRRSGRRTRRPLSGRSYPAGSPRTTRRLSRAVKAAGSSGTSPSRIFACSNRSCGEIGDVVVARIGLGARQRLHQRVTHVQFENWLERPAPVLPRQQARQLAVESAAPATRQAALSVSRCDARTSDTRSPSDVLHGGDDRVSSSLLSDFGSSAARRPCRAAARGEIDFALAQRLQRLAVELAGHRGPQRVDRIGQQQHLDAAGARRLELRIGLQPLERCRRPGSRSRSGSA